MNTGDKVTLRIGTLGQDCHVSVGDASLPNAYAFRLEAEAGEVTRLSIDMRGFPEHDMTETVEGYFVSRKDCDAFLAWLQMRGRA